MCADTPQHGNELVRRRARLEANEEVVSPWATEQAVRCNRVRESAGPEGRVVRRSRRASARRDLL